MREPAHAPMTSEAELILTTDDMPARLLDDILTAKRSITATAYIVRLSVIRHPTAPATIYDRLTLALLDAPRRGLQCRMLASNPLSSGSLGLIDRASRLALKETGWQLRQPPPARLLHAKTWLIDDSIIWIGSHNLTAKTMQRNIEASIRTTSQAITATYGAWYKTLWRKSATP